MSDQSFIENIQFNKEYKILRETIGYIHTLEIKMVEMSPEFVLSLGAGMATLINELQTAEEVIIELREQVERLEFNLTEKDRNNSN